MFVYVDKKRSAPVTNILGIKTFFYVVIATPVFIPVNPIINYSTTHFPFTIFVEFVAKDLVGYAIRIVCVCPVLMYAYVCMSVFRVCVVRNTGV